MIYAEIINERKVMKNFMCFVIFVSIALPVFAVCPITGACAAPADSLLSPSDLQDKYVPNNLNSVRTPATFAPQYVEPYDSMRMNTGETEPQYSSKYLTPQLPYNSNCQFGLCLP